MNLLRAALFFVPAAALPLAALEGSIVVTAALNVPAQFAHILPCRPPVLPQLDQAVYGQPIRCHILLAKPALKDGRAAVRGSFTLIGPEGKNTVLGTDLPLLDAKCGSGVFLSPCTIVITADPDDPSGEYSVKGELHDLNDDSRIAVASHVFRLKSPEYPERTPTRAELNRLITFYYRDPKPHLVPAAFRAFLQWPEPTESKGGKREERRNILAAFAELYRITPQLWETLPAEARRLVRQSQHRNFAIVVNAIGSELEEKLRPRLPKETVAELDRITAHNPLLFRRITKPWQLDALWTRFFVTGLPEPLRVLVKELERKNLLTPVEAKERYGGKLDPGRSAAFLNYLIVAAVDWSLGANMSVHPLVRHYLEADLARGRITDPTAKLVVQRQLIHAERIAAAAAKARPTRTAMPAPSETMRENPGEEKQ